MPYWVSMTDKFMSGWGMANNKINKLVIECETLTETIIVSDNARERKEMIRIFIHRHKKPYYNPNRYFVSEHKKTDYDCWFIPGYFHKETVKEKIKKANNS